MSKLPLVITSLQSKVEKLVHLHGKLRDDFVKSENENKGLAEQAEKQKKEIVALRENIVALKLSDTVKEISDKSDINLKINELVREIDKCITLLNR